MGDDQFVEGSRSCSRGASLVARLLHQGIDLLLREDGAPQISDFKQSPKRLEPPPLAKANEAARSESGCYALTDWLIPANAGIADTFDLTVGFGLLPIKLTARTVPQSAA